MTKVSVIGDTHGCHRQLKLQPGNILIHTGDVTAYGLETEVLDFIDWFEKQPFEHKVFIAGNHDFFFEEQSEVLIHDLLSDYPDVIYLEDSDSLFIGEISKIKPFGYWR